MKISISVASFVACAFSLNAQITATQTPLPDGSTEIRIRNNAPVSLTAFAVSVTDTNGVFEGPLVVYADSAVDPEAMPVLTNQERAIKEVRRVVMRNGQMRRPILEQSIVTAGIFADGATTGDKTLLTRLILRRRSMVQAVDTAIEMLSDAGRHNISRSQLIGHFKRMAVSVNRWYLLPEQQVGRSVYQSIIGKLMALPETELGSAFPPTAFVAHETAMLNRQRVMLLESQPSLADAAFASIR